MEYHTAPVPRAKQSRKSVTALPGIKAPNCRRIFFLLALAAASLARADFTGRVVGVKDGDTIVVLHDGKTETVRLYGIDCPEKKQPFSDKAKQFTSDACFEKDVTVKTMGADRYGRTVGTVILPDGAVLNHKLLSAGMAWWYQQHAPKDQTLQRLHREALTAQKGLFVDPNRIPPWEWRRGMRERRPDRSHTAQFPMPHTIETPSGTAVGGPATIPTGLPTAAKPTATRPTSADTVYITETGKKYHKKGCRSLAKSRIPISRADAVARGYKPCSVCGPN